VRCGAAAAFAAGPPRVLFGDKSITANQLAALSRKCLSWRRAPSRPRFLAQVKETLVEEGDTARPGRDRGATVPGLVTRRTRTRGRGACNEPPARDGGVAAFAPSVAGKGGAVNHESRLASLLGALAAKGWEPGSGGEWDAELTARNYRLIAAARMKQDNLPLAAVAVELLSKHEPDTVRGVMYSVVSAGWLPDTSATSYARIQRLLNALRKKGVIPFQWVVDNVRDTIKPSSWSGLGDFADTVTDAYRKDFWAQLPAYVEVIVEKDTVAGRVSPVTGEYDVSLHPVRGYCSTSFAWGIAQRWKRVAKPITVYYIGDHDPSGRDIERSIMRTLREYSGKDFAWHRLGVNPCHFEQFNVLPLASKKKDARYGKFVEEFGPRCAEVEAIPATALREMVKEAIERHIPPEQWERLRALEAQEKAQWQQVMRQMRGVA
jgi:hypothetical protein